METNFAAADPQQGAYILGAKLKFVLGLHCHQPVGNFDHVFQHGMDVSYRPFLETVERFPALKVVLHYSGPLLEWISEHDPGFFSLVSRLATSGQAEIAGGGHNEPILPVVPRRDAVGQIRHMTRYLKRHFGANVRGGWLTERIWEPHMPSLLAEAGLEYTTVDDYHFLSAGFDPEKLQGYYLSEDQGHSVAIFPISQQLRYMVPFHEVDEVIGFLRRKAEQLPAGSVLTLADDGEKFGMWPGTFDWVYKRKWLDKFFTALTENSDWLETTTFSRVLDSAPASGRVYLPAASYMEMGGWSLPAAAGEKFQRIQTRLERQGELEELFPFLRGSFWRNFLIKYPESGWMHGRMWQVSDYLASTLAPGAYNRATPPAALQHLWRGQTNCAYWHGIFGGLYLPHLRKAIFSQLIRAEKLALRASGAPPLRAQRVDVDRDGEDEIVLANSKLSLVVKPSDGGIIAELDSLEAEFNLTDTLARRPEAYHWKMVEGAEQEHGEEGHASIHERTFEDKVPAKDLIYDPWTRRMLRVHFFASPPASAEALGRMELEDIGDFAAGAWTASGPRGSAGKISLALKRCGRIRLADGSTASLEARKRIAIGRDSGNIAAVCSVVNTSGRKLDTFMGISFNLTVLGPADQSVGLLPAGGELLSLDKPFELNGCRNFTVCNHRDRWQLEFALGKTPLAVYQYPVHTLSQSEGGVDHTYQATCLVPVWPLELKPGGKADFSFDLTLSN